MLKVLPTVTVTLCALVISGCGGMVWRAETHTPGEPIPADGDYLKVHLSSGELFVLESWTVDEQTSTIRGRGIHYDRERESRGMGDAVVNFADISLLETNRLVRSGSTGPIVLTIMTVLTLAVGAVCLSEPRSCFP